jgi:hypothetical protein
MRKSFLRIWSFPGAVVSQSLEYAPVNTILRKPALSIIVIICATILLNFPSYDVALVLHEMDDNWNAIFLQANEPFVDHTQLYDAESHMAKLGFRFVPALLVRSMGITTIAEALVLQLGLLMVFYVLLITFLRNNLTNKHEALLFALPISLIISGHVYASDYRGIFDTLALVFLLAAALLRRSKWVLPALLLAYFTDERAMLASTSLVLLNSWTMGKSGSLKELSRSLIAPDNLLILGSWVAYVLIRITLANTLGLTVTSVDLTYYFKENLVRIPYAFYIGQEGMWILVLALLYHLVRTGNHFFAALVGLNLLGFVLGSMTVVDINRSMSYALVHSLLVLLMLDRYFPEKRKQELLGWAIVVSLVYGDFLPLPLQVYRMYFITQSL